MKDAVCTLCGQPSTGGLWTRGDGYGDGKYVGIPVGRSRFFCWTCVETRRSELPDMEAAITQAFHAHGLCGYIEPWIGRCRAKHPCEKHLRYRCWSCGAPAVRGCSMAGSLVCGVPECADHPHPHGDARS